MLFMEGYRADTRSQNEASHGSITASALFQYRGSTLWPSWDIHHLTHHMIVALLCYFQRNTYKYLVCGTHTWQTWNNSFKKSKSKNDCADCAKLQCTLLTSLCSLVLLLLLENFDENNKAVLVLAINQIVAHNIYQNMTYHVHKKIKKLSVKKYI